MVGSLARRESIGMIRRQIEVGISVLQGEATAIGNDAGAKPGEVAVDERYPITVLVCHSEVHRVAVIVGWAFMVKQLHSLVGAVELGLSDRYACKMSSLVGTFSMLGSVTHQEASAKAIRRALMMLWRYSVELCCSCNNLGILPVRLSSPRMPSAMSATTPCPLGGCSHISMP